MIEAALLVRAGRVRVGLPVSQLQAVTDPTPVVPVPSTEPGAGGGAGDGMGDSPTSDRNRRG